MTLLLDEMYPPALAAALLAKGIEATTAAQAGLGGRPDADILAAAVAEDAVLLTENVSDFARLAGEHVGSGGHHPGVLIALSSRFSRRPDGTAALVAAVGGLANEELQDRLVYLAQPPDASRRARRRK